MKPHVKILWIDNGREPKHPPNPAFPNGIDLDVSGGAFPNCVIALPYPAARCGIYKLKCERCGWRGMVTTAGRTDDPRSLKVACKIIKH